MENAKMYSQMSNKLHLKAITRFHLKELAILLDIALQDDFSSKQSLCRKEKAFVLAEKSLIFSNQICYFLS